MLSSHPEAKRTLCILIWWAQYVLKVMRGTAGVSTHRGIIGGDVNQDLRGAPPTHVSVAVPYAANQVGLKNNKKHAHTTFISIIVTLTSLPMPPSAIHHGDLTYRKWAHMMSPLDNNIGDRWEEAGHDIQCRTNIRYFIFLSAPALSETAAALRVQVRLAWQTNRSFIVFMCERPAESVPLPAASTTGQPAKQAD